MKAATMHPTSLRRLCLIALALAHGSALADTPPAAERIARGLMLQHQERLIFTPCRDRSYTAVEDNSANGELTASLKQFGLTDGQPLYVEVFGEAGEGSLRMHRLNMAQRDARCLAPRRSTGEWRASGTQPQWALTLFEGSATLQRQGAAELSGPASTLQSTPTQVEIAVDAPATAKVRLLRETCRDNTGPGGREAMYAWTAEIEVGGEKLKGCAWRQ